MKEPDLDKFFAGNCSEKEKEKLRIWLEKEPNHQAIFLKKRKLYNTILLNSDWEFSQNKKKTKRPDIRKIIFRISNVAAIFLFIFVSFYLLDNNRNKPEEKTAYQTIHVPFGQRINLDLPDGSQVYLNAGATIKYPVSFNKKIREVQLDGEAYFEVEKNEKSPFHVIAGEHTIEVLGTTFNVSVDNAANTFETALFTGVVKIYNSANPQKTVNLIPDMYVSNIDGNLQVKPIIYKDRFNWRKGILCFRKEKFENIMKIFEKSYGCKIVIQNEKVSKHLYSGKFLQADGIDYALNLLQKSFYFNYTRCKDTHTIIIH